MTTIIEWPIHILTPGVISPNVVPFTRSGGTTLGGITPTTQTDLGYWSIDYGSISMRNKTRVQWQVWQAIRQKLKGRSGSVVVPVRSAISAPYETGRYEPVTEARHGDNSLFGDDTPYVQGAISVEAVGTVSKGSTTISMRVIKGDNNLAGVRFSYADALYETGPAIDIVDDVWTLPIWPAARTVIPDGAYLEFDRPTCICKLADDRGMDVDQNMLGKSTSVAVSFVEDVDYWSA